MDDLIIEQLMNLIKMQQTQIDVMQAQLIKMAESDLQQTKNLTALVNYLNTEKDMNIVFHSKN